MRDARLQASWIEKRFIPFLKELQSDSFEKPGFKKIVIVAGNHDWCHEEPGTAQNVAEALAAAGIIYLQDSAAEIDGVKFYGSPWQPFFYAWAFNFHEFDPANGHSQAVKTWAKIPKDTQVLITHGPAYNILDLAPGHRHVGCPILRDKIFEIRPKLHLFGHIHMSYGAGEMDGIKFGNVALCDEGYKPVNPIQVFEV